MIDETIILQKPNEIYFKLICDISQKMELNEHFAIYADQFQFSPLYVSKVWDGKLKFYDFRNSLLPIGLLPQFIEFCSKFGYNYKFDFDVTEMSNPEITWEAIKPYMDKIFEGTKYYPRDYQQTSIINFLRNKRCTQELSTGAGKSLTIYSVCRIMKNSHKKTLLVVPTVGLVEQMFSDFKDYGWDDINRHVIKLYAKYSSEFRVDINGKDVLISTYQSLIKKPAEFFEQFECVIMDECHKCAGKSLSDILKKCTKATYRLGVTGSLTDSKANSYTIFGYIGPLVYSIKSKELIDRGILSKITIANILLKYPLDECKNVKGRTYLSEVDYVLSHPRRNKVLKWILDNTKEDKNVLILLGRIEKHLDPTMKYLKELYPNKKIYSICGNVNVDERERIRKEMEIEKNVILVGTYATIGTGFNLKNLHTMIMFSSVKSYISCLQSIGRGLRVHTSKDQLLLFDVVDDFSIVSKKGKIHRNYLYKHYLERKKYYKEAEFNTVIKSIMI